MALKNDRYTYRVTWSEEDREYVGLCAEFPSLSWLEKIPEKALSGIRKVVREIVADLKKAKEAIKTVANLDGKKLIDAGEVERLRTEITESFQTKLDEATAENTTLRTQYSSEKMNSAFASSEYIKEKLAVPSDMAQATFGKHFVFKDGKLNPIDEKGEPIYSSSNPGELATFDEALERVVGTYAHRDSILKGSGHSGAGTEAPGDGSGKRTVTREQLSKMEPLEQQKIATSKDVTIID